ncbi:hypothetical protein ACEW7V_01295 [Areca yellow leaf disease phytoplasma]|uniref:hypothetical protein n=1 Tax=Areca yellow leaf disease phytoplasma TaxID=927614 RepID=UPI0035B56599
MKKIMLLEQYAQKAILIDGIVSKEIVIKHLCSQHTFYTMEQLLLEEIKFCALVPILPCLHQLIP